MNGGPGGSSLIGGLTENGTLTACQNVPVGFLLTYG